MKTMHSVLGTITAIVNEKCSLVCEKRYMLCTKFLSNSFKKCISHSFENTWKTAQHHMFIWDILRDNHYGQLYKDTLDTLTASVIQHVM